MTVIEELYRCLGRSDSPQGGVKGIRKVCSFYGEV